MSTSEVFKQFYNELVDTLPMDDSGFMAKLFKHNLLPGDLKEQIGKKQTARDKATHFLDNSIKPNMHYGNSDSFSQLLDVMKESEYDTLKMLVEKIKIALSSSPGYYTHA